MLKVARNENWNFVIVVAYTGPTERKFLNNIEDIVRAGLPFTKVKEYFSNREAAENFLLNKLSFCVEAQKVSYLNYIIHLFSEKMWFLPHKGLIEIIA